VNLEFKHQDSVVNKLMSHELVNYAILVFGQHI